MARPPGGSDPGPYHSLRTRHCIPQAPGPSKAPPSLLTADPEDLVLALDNFPETLPLGPASMAELGGQRWLFGPPCLPGSHTDQQEERAQEDLGSGRTK